MFQNMALAENLAEDVGGLVDDRGEGNGIDDPAQAVPLRMIQREGQGSQGLAAAGRYGEGEQPRRLRRSRPHGA